MPAHMEGLEGNLLAGTQIQSLRVPGPLDGALESVSTLCVSLSLTLFALGSADPTGGFFLRTLSFEDPLAIMGPIWDMVAVSHAVVVGAMYEG
jgi:hypothetical protein